MNENRESEIKNDCIIINYEKDKKKIGKLLKKLKLGLIEEKNKKYKSAIILIIDKKISKQISEKKGIEKYNYINSDDFFILRKYIFLYNPTKKICILNNDSVQDPKFLEDVEIFLESTLNYFIPNSKIWLNIELKNPYFNEIIKKMCDIGFHSPYITNKTPNNKKIKDSLALMRKNIKKDIDMIDGTINKIYDIISQYKNNKKTCIINAKLSKNAINFLKSSTKLGITINDNGSSSQKELSGELFVKKVVKEKNKFIYIIDIDHDSVRSGGEENVNVYPTRYNFHSHPHEAYVRHSVKSAYPSMTDYLGYLKLGINTIFHCVATIEGIYVLSFSDFWGPRLKNISKNFIKKNYQIKHDSFSTPQKYVEHVNNILYKKHKIFHVEFLSWDKADSILTIYYSKIMNTCMPSEKIINNFKQIH